MSDDGLGDADELTLGCLSVNVARNGQDIEETEQLQTHSTSHGRTQSEMSHGQEQETIRYRLRAARIEMTKDRRNRSISLSVKTISERICRLQPDYRVHIFCTRGFARRRRDISSGAGDFVSSSVLQARMFDSRPITHIQLAETNQLRVALAMTYCAVRTASGWMRSKVETSEVS